ncbi:MAG: hypothetical protein H6933_02665 [Burkholderiaceae bacterium]|nr:hypothetical protein [Burkholderiaceae bacterium]
MRLMFTKGSGKYDQMRAIRPDGTSEVIDSPKQRIIPHDMVHYAVEHTLASRGFLGRVKEGESASFQMLAEDQSDSVERLVEVFQGDEWSGGATPPADMLELYKVTCGARSCSMLPVNQEAIIAVRVAIANLSAQWHALPVGQSLELVL